MDNSAKALYLAMIAATCFSVTGCASDPKAANDGNFAKVISQYYADPEKSKICVSGQYDPKLDLPGQHVEYAKYSYSDDSSKKNEALVAAGLLKRTGPTSFTQSAWRGPITEKLYSFEPLSKATAKEKGVSYTASSFGGSDDIAMCAGLVALEKIVNFTTPADAFGAHMTSVKYTTHFADQQTWAKNDALLAAYPDLKKTIDDVGKNQEITLVLTDKGWEVPN